MKPGKKKISMNRTTFELGALNKNQILEKSSLKYFQDVLKKNTGNIF